MLRTAFRPSVRSCHYDIVRNFTDFQSDASGGPYDGRHVLDLYVRLCVRACVPAEAFRDRLAVAFSSFQCETRYNT